VAVEILRDLRGVRKWTVDRAGTGDVLGMAHARKCDGRSRMRGSEHGMREEHVHFKLYVMSTRSIRRSEDLLALVAEQDKMHCNEVVVVRAFQ